MMSHVKMQQILCLIIGLSRFRMEPARLSLSADSVREPRSNSSDNHTPLCSRTFERTPRHPLHPAAGSGSVGSAGCLLVTHRHHSWRTKVTALLALHLCSVFGLLHIQRHLPAIYVSLPSSVYSDFLHRSGSQCLVPVCRGFRTRCRQAGV